MGRREKGIGRRGKKEGERREQKRDGEKKRGEACEREREREGEGERERETEKERILSKKELLSILSINQPLHSGVKRDSVRIWSLSISQCFFSLFSFTLKLVF